MDGLITPKAFLFDLSEVFISGLLGIEVPLSQRLGVTIDEVYSAFGGEPLRQVFCGQRTELDYLEYVLNQHNWQMPVVEIQQIIRQNFHYQVPGMMSVLEDLSKRYPLALLSDHGAEWVEYILHLYDFFDRFKRLFFSFELGQTKQEPSIFHTVLSRLEWDAKDVIFIDDSALNIENAAAAGLRGIRFESAGQLKQELCALGVWWG